jgi:uroporphyrinogen-III synthase
VKLLLTRPREQAEALAIKLRARNIDVWIEPMLSIIPHTNVKLETDDYQALLVTSSNGADSLAEATTRRDLKLYAVGDVTAATLSHHDFADVWSADGNADDLAAMVEKDVDPSEGSLLHVGGVNLAGDLISRLRSKGYKTDHIALYHTVAASALTREVRSAMANREIDGVLFFSPETARIFVALVVGALCEKALADMTAFCLSEAAAKAANRISWGHLVISDRPAAASLIAAVMASQ